MRQNLSLITDRLLLGPERLCAARGWGHHDSLCLHPTSWTHSFVLHLWALQKQLCEFLMTSCWSPPNQRNYLNPGYIWVNILKGKKYKERMGARGLAFQEPGRRGGVIASMLQVKSISFVTLWVNNWICSVDSGGTLQCPSCVFLNYTEYL